MEVTVILGTAGKKLSISWYEYCLLLCYKRVATWYNYSYYIKCPTQLILKIISKHVSTVLIAYL